MMMQVDANPEAEITWRKDGDRRVLGNFPVLDIGVVSRSVVGVVVILKIMITMMIARRDTGTYSCTATNDLGQSAPGYVDVDTHCK